MKIITNHDLKLMQACWSGYVGLYLWLGEINIFLDRHDILTTVDLYRNGRFCSTTTVRHGGARIAFRDFPEPLLETTFKDDET